MEPLPAPSALAPPRCGSATRRSTPFWAAWAGRSRRTRRRRCSWRRSARAIDAISAAGFAQETAKKGEATALQVPRADGGARSGARAHALRELGLRRQGAADRPLPRRRVHCTPRDANTAPLWNKLWDECGVQPCVASVAYRVAPEHPAPAAFDDAMAAVKFLLQSDELGLRFLYEPRASAPVGLVGGRRHRARRRRRPFAAAATRARSARSSWTARCSTRGAAARRTRATRRPRASRRQSGRAGRGPPALGDGRTAEEALADPRVCPHAAPGALAGVGGVRTVVATALDDAPRRGRGGGGGAGGGRRGRPPRRDPRLALRLALRQGRGAARRRRARRVPPSLGILRRDRAAWSRATNVRSPYALKIDHPCTAAISRSVWLRSPRSRPPPREWPGRARAAPAARAWSGGARRTTSRATGCRARSARWAAPVCGGGGGEGLPGGGDGVRARRRRRRRRLALAGRRRRRRPRHDLRLEQVLRLARRGGARAILRAVQAARRAPAVAAAKLALAAAAHAASRPPRRRRSCRPTGTQRCPCRTGPKNCGLTLPRLLTPRCCGAAPGRCALEHASGHLEQSRRSWTTLHVDDARAVPALRAASADGREHISERTRRSFAQRRAQVRPAVERLGAGAAGDVRRIARVEAGGQCLDVRGAVARRGRTRPCSAAPRPRRS